MGIFSYRRKVLSAIATEAPVWQPDGSGLHVTDGSDMDDPGCAGSEAFGTRFALAEAPGASITIWAYPVWGGPAAVDGYTLGARIEYQADDGAAPWSAAEYHGDEDERWVDADALATAIREGCETLAAAPRDEDSEDPFGCFDWDGVPW